MYRFVHILENGYGQIGAKSGFASMPYAVCAYPGATVTFSRDGSWVIGSHNSDDDYWHLSKLIVKGAGGGIGTTLGGRIVGCAVTDVNDSYGTTAAIQRLHHHRPGIPIPSL